MDKLTQLKQDRAKLIKKQRKLVENAEEEDRTLNSEEKKKFNRMDEEIDELEERIENVKKTREREKRLVEKELDKETKNKDGNKEYKKIFNKALREGRAALNREETRALQEDTDSEGGYLVPTSFANSIMQALEERNVMRRIATVSSTQSEKKIPVAADSGQAGWIDEEGSYPSADPSFSQKAVDAYKAGTIIKASEELLYDNTYNLEGYIQSRFVRRIGDLEEAAFINGDSATSNPTGFLQDAEVGVTASATDAVTADELIELFYSASKPYRRNARWLLKDAVAKSIRKLKDNNGNYLWQPGLQAGQPDVLLGKPVETAADMPDMATANKPIAFGDFSYYEIFDRQGIFVQRLNELYAENGQVGFRAYKRTDGLLMLAEAIQALEMASA